ncbi:MAG: hypothetical protein A2046_14510 [Bacteroidetes bacterium GWA2_30_7]|nr:MAG: hypothetical protein A2046_14510 [Bacteroidetes bacterium GWA2_30_7]
MNITKENTNDLNAILKINITKADYEEKYEKAIREYKKKIKMDGFRPGMIPTGLVKKLYGTAIMLDEINRLISDSIHNYINENKLKIIGDPLPHAENNAIDFDNDTEFNFTFDIGLYPVFDLKLNKKEKYDYFEVKIDENLIEDEIKYYCNYFGELKEIEEITDEEVVVEGDLQELDSVGNIFDSGIKTEAVKVFIKIIKDEDAKKRFLAAKKFDIIKFHAKSAFPNDTDRAGLLKISKEKAIENNSDFQISINKIEKFSHCEVNQSLYDKIFGEGTVTGDEQFKEKIIESLKVKFENESNYKFKLDAKEKIKLDSEVELPSEFLKRWVSLVNKEFTPEQIEKEFPTFIEDLKWQMIKEKIIAENKFNVIEEELKKEAANVVKYQYAQYGITNISEEHLEPMIAHMLKEDKTVNKFRDKILEDKIFDFIKENVKLETKEVTLEELQNMFKQ